MIYVVNGNEFDDVYDAIDECICDDYHRYDDDFEEWVNDEYDDLEIRGHYFAPYDILREMNEDLLDELRDDFCELKNEEDRDEARYELRDAYDGEVVYVQGNQILCVEESGDCDGDEAFDLVANKIIESAKKYIEDQHEIQRGVAAAEKEREEELLKMFQVIK